MWYSEKDGGVYVEIRVVPKSSREAIGPVEGDRLKVRVTAPPVDGKANDAVIRVVAKRLGVARRDVTVTRGQSSRNKTLFIQGVSSKEVESLAKDG